MRKVLTEINFWRHDLCGCLHNCLGTILLRHQHNPIFVLGASWDFYYPPGDVRREEYYYPCRWSTLAQSLAPYHPIRSQWHEPSDAQTAYQEVRAMILQGEPALVAVDNYYLPFRPAYHDVHSNHLILVYGFDDEMHTVEILDVTPPAFRGSIGSEVLQAARESPNRAKHERDLFFTDVPIKYRWLEVEIAGQFPQVTREWVQKIIQENLQRFWTPASNQSFSGTHGIRHYVETLPQKRSDQQAVAAMDELFLVSYFFMESTALHAAFLSAVEQMLTWPHLRQIGRQIERIAHHCTALRIMAARGRECPSQMIPRIIRRFNVLLGDLEMTLRELEWVLSLP